AALAAFQAVKQTNLEHRRQEFLRSGDFLLPSLRGLGFEILVEPKGACYLYADCNRITQDSYTFATDLLEKAGVAITPGVDFGRHKAARHVRFAYTTSMQQLQLGVERIAAYLGR
ncbi:MAG: aminotransferase class I/II-fold pyridoxal phosphate-dependent enzyme, partial [Thiogranum sp.]